MGGLIPGVSKLTSNNTPTTQVSAPGTGLVAQPYAAPAPGAGGAQGPYGPIGSPTPTAPKPAPTAVTPSQAYGMSTAAYGPQQQYYNTQAGLISAGQALNGQQLQDQVNYANAQYGTGIQNLGLDQQNIDAQRMGLAGDRAYNQGIYNQVLQNSAADRGFATHDSQIAQRLYAALMGQNHIQAGLYSNQLAQQLAQIGYQMSQARGSAANDTQQLGEQVGAQGAFGSRGAGERQHFIQSTLANALGGFTQQQGLERTQHGLSESQLAEQRASNLSTRDNQMNINRRRIQAANNQAARGGLEYNHGLSQLNLTNNQLNIAAARLGVSRQSLLNTLNNAVNSANLGYGSGALQAAGSLAQNAFNQSTLQQQIGSTAQGLLGANQNPYGG